MPAPNDLLTEAETSDYLGDVPPGTLKQWRYLGRGPAFIRLSGRHIRYSRRDLDSWVASHRVEPTTGAA